jgi:hypothetical protein
MEPLNKRRRTLSEKSDYCNAMEEIQIQSHDSSESGAPDNPRGHQSKQMDRKFTITIDSTSPSYDQIQTFLCKKYIEQKKESDDFINLRLFNVKTGEYPKISYYLPMDTNCTIQYNDQDIVCSIKKASRDHGTSFNIAYLYQMTLITKNKHIMDKMLYDACLEPETLLIYHYDPKACYWQKYGKVQKRNEATLILNESDKYKLLDDITKFTDDEKSYEKYGMPYKRNYLFHGKPGTGKTSLVNVIANKTERSIYIISFDSDLTDTAFYNAVNDINIKKAILLLEDIDCIFQDRSTNMNNSRISFSALLNILDGVTRTKGLITIVTTNYVKKLDPALMRPGRIDMMIEFNIISLEQITGLLKLYDISLREKELKEITKICQSNELTPAVLAGFMFRNRGTGLNTSNYIKLFKKYLEEIDVALVKHNYRHMYS